MFLPFPFSLVFAYPILCTLGGLAFFYILGNIRYIPNTRVGIVEKRISRKGSLSSGIIALNGEAGFQPALLRGGLHFLPLFQYRMHL